MPGLQGGAPWTSAVRQDPMSLLQHLNELRTRLVRVLMSTLVLSLVGLWAARPLFAWMMRPVLAALPTDARSLVYTSGIEQVNVLIKVGLYSGVILSTP